MVMQFVFLSLHHINENETEQYKKKRRSMSNSQMSLVTTLKDRFFFPLLFEITL